MAIDLAKLARPWTAADAECLRDPVRRSPRIDDVIDRVSIVATEPVQVLRCWDPRYRPLDVRALLSACGVSIEHWEIALSPVCTTPIESGYLERMRLSPANDGVGAADAIDAFAQLQAERYPDIERYLVERYGELTPERERNDRFRVIDYPGFDLGGMSVGLGIFVEETYIYTAIWCWSRVVNHHK